MTILLAGLIGLAVSLSHSMGKNEAITELKKEPIEKIQEEPTQEKSE